MDEQAGQTAGLRSKQDLHIVFSNFVAHTIWDQMFTATVI